VDCSVGAAAVNSGAEVVWSRTWYSRAERCDITAIVGEVRSQAGSGSSRSYAA
jgi:hypothetical protein